MILRLFYNHIEPSALLLAPPSAAERPGRPLASSSPRPAVLRPLPRVAALTEALRASGPPSDGAVDDRPANVSAMSEGRTIAPRGSRRLPPPVFFITGAVSLYWGAALAVIAFRTVSPVGLAWLRVVGAALIMLSWRRPWRGQWSWPRLRLVAAFGTALVAMNFSFYLAIGRLSLGTATAIEFLGPIVVAAVTTRTRRDLLALVLALAGVGLLADVQRRGSASGVLFALLAATLWAFYILLGSRVAVMGEGIDSLAVGMAIGALVFAAIGLPAALPAFGRPMTLLLGLSLGLFSNVIPYALDQVVLRRVRAGQFALLLSLLPATAAVMGFIVLHQVPLPVEAVGIILVVLAVGLRSRSVA